jgi:hypothetical protein
MSENVIYIYKDIYISKTKIEYHYEKMRVVKRIIYMRRSCEQIR